MKDENWIWKLLALLAIMATCVYAGAYVADRWDIIVELPVQFVREDSLDVVAGDSDKKVDTMNEKADAPISKNADTAAIDAPSAHELGYLVFDASGGPLPEDQYEYPAVIINAAKACMAEATSRKAAQECSENAAIAIQTLAEAAGVPSVEGASLDADDLNPDKTYLLWNSNISYMTRFASDIVRHFEDAPGYNSWGELFTQQAFEDGVPDRTQNAWQTTEEGGSIWAVEVH